MTENEINSVIFKTKMTANDLPFHLKTEYYTARSRAEVAEEIRRLTEMVSGNIQFIAASFYAACYRLLIPSIQAAPSSLKSCSHSFRKSTIDLDIEKHLAPEKCASHNSCSIKQALTYNLLN